MADVVTLPKKHFLMGDERAIRLAIRESSGGDLSLTTAVLNLYNAAGTQLLTNQAMTGTGTTRRIFAFTLTAKGAGHMTAAGNYTCYVKVTNGGEIKTWKIPIKVEAVPD